MAIIWPLASWLLDHAVTFGEVSPAAAFSLTIGLLGLDAVTMLPHGLIGALAGTALPWQLAALATWLGIMLASSINHAIGRFAGRPLALRLLGGTNPERLLTVATFGIPATAALTYGITQLVARHRLPHRD